MTVMPYLPDPNNPQAVAMQHAIALCVSGGWRVESVYGNTATMVSGTDTNHVLHAILTLFTCGLWLLAWIGAIALGGQRRMIVSVDESGTVSYLAHRSLAS